MRPEMTLVICTRDREKSLSACLRAVAAMEGIETCQVVVVDNSSTGGARGVVEALATAGAGTFEFVCEPRAGLSRARNRGIRQARSDLVLFSDDDCYPEAGFLREARAVFADPSIHFFGGRVLLHDPRDHPITIQESPVAMPLSPGVEVIPGMIHGANMGFRRSVFEKLGGFNVLLGAGTALKCGEDTEMIARASAAGFAGGYFPGPTVRHHHQRNARDAETLMRAYDIGRGAFYASMLGTPALRMTYLKRWRNSFAWSRRRLLMRELRGATRYLGATLLATLAGYERVPRIP